MTTTATTTEPPGRRPGSLRRRAAGLRPRLLVLFVGLLAGSIVAQVVVVRQIQRVALEDEVKESLVQETREFGQLVRRGIDPDTGERLARLPVTRVFDVFRDRNVPDEGEAIFAVVGGVPYRPRRVAGTDVRALAADPAFRAATTDLSRTRRGVTATPAGDAFWIAVPVRRAGRLEGAFVVANFPRNERDEIDEQARLVALVSGTVLVLAALIAFGLAGQVLRPLRELERAAREIGESDLSRRIPVEGHDEVSELARTFNAMLDRLERAFASQRAFLNDAGHELRTPITIVRGHLELLGEDPAEREETLALVRDELARMSRLVEELVLLAKAEQPGFLRLDVVDLNRFGDEVLAKARALADRDWRLARDGGGTVVADRQRLTQAVVNLVANAAHHTGDGDEIEIGVGTRGPEAEIWVRDTGPGVPSEERAAIFERFRRGRGSEQRPDGAGLGLAIVRAIAEAHHGRVELESVPGAGATFRLRLPVDPPNEVEASP